MLSISVVALTLTLQAAPADPLAGCVRIDPNSLDCGELSVFGMDEASGDLEEVEAMLVRIGGGNAGSVKLVSQDTSADLEWTVRSALGDSKGLRLRVLAREVGGRTRVVGCGPRKPAAAPRCGPLLGLLLEQGWAKNTVRLPVLVSGFHAPVPEGCAFSKEDPERMALGTVTCGDTRLVWIETFERTRKFLDAQHQTLLHDTAGKRPTTPVPGCALFGSPEFCLRIPTTETTATWMMAARSDDQTWGITVTCVSGTSELPELCRPFFAPPEQQAPKSHATGKSRR